MWFDHTVDSSLKRQLGDLDVQFFGFLGEEKLYVTPGGGKHVFGG